MKHPLEAFARSRSRSATIFLALCLLADGCSTHREDTVTNSAHASATTPTPRPPPKPSGGLEAFPPNEWKSLFDGQTLRGWKVTDFAGHGDVRIDDKKLVIEAGSVLSGITWTNALPQTNYEIVLDAMKVEGGDFFCGLTFPVGEACCSLIVGGWGGGVVGISSIDNQDASENETTKFMNFTQGRWYHVRVRVTREKIEAWIDQEKMADVEIAGRKISMRFGEIELSQPLGLATYQTRAALRDIKLMRF